MSKKILIGLFLLIGFSISAFANDPSFLDGVTKANAHVDDNVRGTISTWVKIFIGLLPLILAVVVPLIAHKILKKRVVQNEDEDAWKIIVVDFIAFLVGAMLGIFIVFLMGEFLLIKHGGGDAGLLVFSNFWSDILITR